jgi:hypothetical protein
MKKVSFLAKKVVVLLVGISLLGFSTAYAKHHHHHHHHHKHHHHHHIL